MNSNNDKSAKSSVPENELVESLEQGNSNAAARTEFHVQHCNGTELLVPKSMSLSNVFVKIEAIQEAITKMELLGLKADERYQQLVTLRTIYLQSNPQQMLQCYGRVAAKGTLQDNNSAKENSDVEPSFSNYGFSGFCCHFEHALPSVPKVTMQSLKARAQLIRESVSNYTPGSCRLQTELELRVWYLMHKCEQLRAEIKEDAYRRKNCKICNRRNVNAARATDYTEFVAEVCMFSAKFWEYHRKRKQQLQSLSKAVLMHFNKCERLQTREQQRLEHERLQRLMEDDDDGYRQLIDQKKDKRLTYLLNQIDECIAKLMEIIKQHYQVEQQRKTLKQCQLFKEKNELLRNDNFECLGEQSAVGDLRVDVRERATGEMLTGNAAPKLRELAKWLQEHQGWTWVVSKDCVEATDLKNEEIKTGLNNVEDEYREEAQCSHYNVARIKCDPIVLQPTLLVNGQLKEYQLKGLQWLVSLYNNNLNGILADEMGLGKTIQTIALIAYLVERMNNHGPFLIVVPLSTLSNWIFEFQKWLPSINVLKYKGGLAMRRQLQKQMRRQQLNVVLTTFEYAVRDKAALSKWSWQYLIVDEGHRMKNHEYKMANTLNNNYDVRHRLLLTDTPLQNNLPELWSLLNFLHPSIFQSCDTFEQWFNAPFVKTGEKVKLNEEENGLIIRRLHKVLSLFLLRRLKNKVVQQEEVGGSVSSRMKLELDDNVSTEAEERLVKKSNRSNRLMLKELKKKQVMQLDEDSDDDPMPMQE